MKDQICLAEDFLVGLPGVFKGYPWQNPVDKDRGVSAPHSVSLSKNKGER